MHPEFDAEPRDTVRNLLSDLFADLEPDTEPVLMRWDSQPDYDWSDSSDELR